jgi:hypothetical protein
LQEKTLTLMWLIYLKMKARWRWSKSLGYSAAPVVIAGDHHWSGFRMAQIEDVIYQIEGKRSHDARQV